MIISFTREAEDDLEAISDYIARDNWRRALSFVQELRAACADLATSPTRYRLVPGYEVRGLRRRPYGNHLIFYRATDTEVRVTRVIHGARDYESILFADLPSSPSVYSLPKSTRRAS